MTGAFGSGTTHFHPPTVSPSNSRTRSWIASAEVRHRRDGTTLRQPLAPASALLRAAEQMLRGLLEFFPSKHVELVVSFAFDVTAELISHRGK